MIRYNRGIVYKHVETISKRNSTCRNSGKLNKGNMAGYDKRCVKDIILI